MSFVKGSSEINAHELLVLENRRLTEEVKNLKQLVADLYIAIATGKTSPPMPTNLLGAASSSAHQARGSPTKFEDPRYSPDFPHYRNDTSDGRSSKIRPWAPHPSQMGHTSPQASVPPFTGPIRRENLGRKDERERCQGSKNEKEYKKPHSYPRAQQKHNPESQPPKISKYSNTPLYSARAYVPAPLHPQWRAASPQPINNTPQKYFHAPPNPTHRSKKAFRPCPYHKMLRMQKKKELTPIGESYTSVFEKLQALDMLRPVKGGMHPRDKVDESRQCAYHSGAPGHDTEDCHFLKKDIQALIDNGQIQVEGSDAPDINQNSLPVCDDVHMVGMVDVEDLRAESAMPIVPVGDVSIGANQMLVTVNCVAEIVFRVADRVKGEEMKKTNMSLEKPIPYLTQSFIKSKEVKSTPMKVGQNEEKQKMLPDSENFFGISMAHFGERLNNA